MTRMPRVFVAALSGALATGCGSDAPAAPSPPSGSSSTTPPVVTVTISIVASSGSQAFTPNPAAVPAGQTVVFRNNSGGTHHIVADNGVWDAGTIAPGGTSSPVNVNGATTVSYHCTIHSSMVGGIN